MPSSLSFGERLSRYLKWKWFRLFHDASGESVRVKRDGLDLTFPTRYVIDFVFHEYEPVTRRAFLDALRPGITVLDVGANIGYFSLLAARKVGPAGAVHAVEPGTDNLEYLRGNVARNGFENVVIHPLAAGTRRRTRTFHLTEYPELYSFYEHPLSGTTGVVEVQEAPLDELIHGPVDLVKIDVEGAEIEVLEGMGRILSENPSLVLIAEWNFRCIRGAGYDPLELPDRLKKLGLTDITVLDDQEKKVRTLEETLRIMDSGSQGPEWYVNLRAARPR